MRYFCRKPFIGFSGRAGVALEGEDSVHLCRYPEVKQELIDTGLETEVALVRQVVSMGRSLRERHKLKTRQPLAAVRIVHHEESFRESLQRQADLIAQELNVKEVQVQPSDADLTTMTFKANYKTLGRRFGKQMKVAAAEIQQLSRADWARLQEGEEIEVLGQVIGSADVLVQREAKGMWLLRPKAR